MVTMTQLAALVVGAHPDYSWQLVSLLRSCAFSVDALTRFPEFFRHYTDAHVIDATSNQPLLDAALRQTGSKHYDWVIVADNRCLRDLALRIDIPLASRLALAPVMAEKDLGHLHSKAGLAQRLQGAGFPTPDTVVTHGIDDIGAAVDQLGCPVVLKLDSSAAGRGLVRIHDTSDLSELPDMWQQTRSIVQRFIQGREISINALFFHGELAHVTVMHPLERRQWGGEWVAMRAEASHRHPAIIAEVRTLGRILGIHGFTNMAAIFDGERRMYIEADIRPNVWSTRGIEVGDDPAVAIRERFGAPHPATGSVTGATPELLAYDYVYPPRLTAEQRAHNAYNWREQFPQGFPAALSETDH
jgi:hypothetical protein